MLSTPQDLKARLLSDDVFFNAAGRGVPKVAGSTRTSGLLQAPRALQAPDDFQARIRV